jgi:tetratricopeptide (TPR) repeat protein
MCIRDRDKEVMQKAINDFDQAISKNKQFYLALFNKGRALYKLGDFSQAEIAYTKATEIKPDHASSWIGKADSLRALRKNDQAFEAYSEATNIDGKSFEAWYKRGKMEEEMGRYQDASSSYKQAQEINPTNQDVIQAIRRSQDNLPGK